MLLNENFNFVLGTHYFENATELLNESYDLCFKGREGFFDEFSFMSNCLGVGATALTQDDFVILMQRAQWTGEAPGKLDRPGGHPEPDLLLSNAPKEYQDYRQDLLIDSLKSIFVLRLSYSIYSDLKEADVLKEIFQSPQNELRDEINIGLDYQSEPLLLGLIRDMDLGGRCAFDFLIKLSLTKEQVTQKYQSGQQIEADESTKLLFVSKADIQAWTIPITIESLLTHHALGGLRLFHSYLNL